MKRRWSSAPLTLGKQAVLAQLPEMIKQNITVKGRSWQEYLDQEGDGKGRTRD